jgi:ABC-2 type transport system ATP-binding protein
MAIMNKGQVLLTGEPNAAIGQLAGQVWRKQVTKASLADYEAHHTVLSTRLVGGQPLIHVFAGERPEEGFEQVPPDLEDVYFQRLRLQARAA